MRCFANTHVLHPCCITNDAINTCRHPVLIACAPFTAHAPQPTPVHMKMCCFSTYNRQTLMATKKKKKQCGNDYTNPWTLLFPHPPQEMVYITHPTPDPP
ncbi:hypothetical protein L208DRAFT_1394423 [Tricholoma matsutake]|nr:hypothetical protein L208DRAFT_1394423 [Tricholoma matsutake 945]